MAEKKRKAREAHPRINREAPAYRVIYGVFGGLTPFCQATGLKPGSAHRWLDQGLIPQKHHPHILQVAREQRKRLPPSYFVPQPEAAAA